MVRTLSGVSLILVLGFAVDARADECTHELVVQSMGVLQSVVDGGRAGFPTLPSDAPNIGPNAAIPAIEQWDANTLALVEKNVTAAHHHVDAIRLALEGQCGEPFTQQERTTAMSLLAQFHPWITAWEAALPAERTRRASDKAAAALACGTAKELADTEGRIAQEKANPAGVVDLNYLHTSGRMVQSYTYVYAARKTLFLRDRKKAFTPAFCAR